MGSVFHRNKQERKPHTKTAGSLRRAALQKQLPVAFAVPYAICVLICIGNRVYPFGSACILHVDMYHQYVPFFAELQRKLQSGGSLMYSWNLGLGSDFVALYAYYLASPLNFLLLLCPKRFVIEFMTLLILFKIGLGGAGFYGFLQYRFGEPAEWKGIPAMLPKLVFSTGYALSGFVAAYSWDIMWMDVVALAPFAVWGLLRMLKSGRPGLYYMALALAIWSNYYLALMLCIFLVFVFLAWFFEHREHRLRNTLRFVYYSLLAGGTSAVLLIPESIVLSYSGSQGFTFPSTVEWYFSLLQMLGRSAFSAENYTGNDHWPNLYAGAFSLLLLVLYALNRGIALRKKLPRLLMVGFFWLGFMNNYLDFLWHGLHFPDSLPGRQSFLYAFLLLTLGYETLRHWKEIRVWEVGAALALTEAVLFFSGRVSGESVTAYSALIFTGILLVCYALLLLVHRFAHGTARLCVRELACVFAIGELAFHMSLTGFATVSRTEYRNHLEAYGRLLEAAREDAAEEGTLFYRVEDTGRRTKNDDMYYGYPSGTQFSSLMNINVSHFYQKYDMEGGKNFYCENGATPLFSTMLSVRYRLSSLSGAEGTLLQLKAQEGSSYLYESRYVLPPGFVIPEAAVTASGYVTGGDKIGAVNAFGRALGAEADQLSYVEVRASERPGSTTLSFGEDGIYYAVYDTCSSDSLTIEYDNGDRKKYAKTTHRYLLELGEMHAGDTVSVTNGRQETLSFSVYRLNTDAMVQAYETLAAQPFVLSRFSDTVLEGTVEVSEAGSLVFSIPCEEGWSLTVDGEKTDAEAMWDTFLSVPLAQGEHRIRLTYRTPGIVPGALISLVCVLLFVLSYVIRKNCAILTKD